MSTLSASSSSIKLSPTILIGLIAIFISSFLNSWPAMGVAARQRPNSSEEQIIRNSGDGPLPYSRIRRAAIANPINLWPAGIIPYEITYNYTGHFLQMIHISMRMWMKETCLIFTEREAWHTSWLRIEPGACGCCSQVGRQVIGAQYLYLGEECDRPGIMAHEFGHAIGFWHEHTRPDRDDYIYVIDDNVDHDQKYNFAKKTHEDVDSLGEPYDPHSIMHYAPNTFSKSGLHLTILLKHSDYSNENLQNGHGHGVYDQYLNAMGQLGQRIRPSKGDIVQTNKLYRCPPCGGNIFLRSPKQSVPIEPIDDITQCHYCAWRLLTAPGNVIVVEIEEMQLYLGQIAIVYDSYQRNLRILGYVNGREQILRKSSKSSSHVSFIELWGANVQEYMEATPRFRLTAKVVCGGRMSAPYAFISNPAYPEATDDSAVCEWTVNGPSGAQIDLIIGYLSIAGSSDDDLLTGLIIFDGNHTDNNELPVLKRLTSEENKSDVQSVYLSSRSNSLKILMASHNGGSIAFRAVYKIQPANECSRGNGGCEQICTSSFGSMSCSCDVGYRLMRDGRSCKTLSSIESVLRLVNIQRNRDLCQEHILLGSRRRFFVIRSPKDDQTNRYPANVSCSWLIEAPRRSRITFKFEEFEIEGSMGSCAYDRLQFSQLDPNTRKPLATRMFCGNRLPRPFTSRSNMVNVSFVTDASNNGRGFVLKFKIC